MRGRIYGREPTRSSPGRSELAQFASFFGFGPSGGRDRRKQSDGWFGVDARFYEDGNANEARASPRDRVRPENRDLLRRTEGVDVIDRSLQCAARVPPRDDTTPRANLELRGSYFSPGPTRLCRRGIAVDKALADPSKGCVRVIGRLGSGFGRRKYGIPRTHLRTFRWRRPRPRSARRTRDVRPLGVRHRESTVDHVLGGAASSAAGASIDFCRGRSQLSSTGRRHCRSSAARCASTSASSGLASGNATTSTSGAAAIRHVIGLSSRSPSPLRMTCGRCGAARVERGSMRPPIAGADRSAVGTARDLGLVEGSRARSERSSRRARCRRAGAT